MKKLVLIAALVSTSAAFAQKSKQSAPPPAAAPVYTSQKVLGGNFGMNQSAINLGVSIDSGHETGDWGGSFFLQTEKEDNGVKKVYQVMTFGAHVNLNVFDQNGWTVDLRPGANITMVSDVPSASGGKNDKTVLGPSLRWSVTHRMASGNEFGIERLEVWNWFEKDVNREDAFTSLVFRTRF